MLLAPVCRKNLATLVMGASATEQMVQTKRNTPQRRHGPPSLVFEDDIWYTAHSEAHRPSSLTYVWAWGIQ